MRRNGETRCIDQQKPNTHKNEKHEEGQSDLLHDLPDWLHEIRENFVDECNPSDPRRNPELGHRGTSNSSHELPMESRAKVVSGSVKHSVFTKTRIAISV